MTKVKNKADKCQVSGTLPPAPTPPEAESEYTKKVKVAIEPLRVSSPFVGCHRRARSEEA